ncbi:MAG TPA: futalosine hydrolase [Gemmatimonadaceae bacterium]|jgi:futalosine hydrolase
MSLTKHFSFAVCFSTDLEGNGLPTSIAGRSIALVKTGVGAVNAAFALTRFLSENDVDAVLNCGIGGAYPSSDLAPGEAVCAESETYGDLGADSPTGFLDMEAIGFPLIPGPEPIYNRLTLDLFPAKRRAAFITCTTCTGTDAAARALVERTGGVVESMEGAAVVHVARLLGVKVGEVRGISNMVGNRERSAWRIPEAAAAARASLIAWIEEGAC